MCQHSLVNIFQVEYACIDKHKRDTRTCLQLHHTNRSPLQKNNHALCVDAMWEVYGIFHIVPLCRYTTVPPNTKSSQNISVYLHAFTVVFIAHQYSTLCLSEKNNQHDSHSTMGMEMVAYFVGFIRG